MLRVFIFGSVSKYFGVRLLALTATNKVSNLSANMLLKTNTINAKMIAIEDIYIPPPISPIFKGFSIINPSYNFVLLSFRE